MADRGSGGALALMSYDGRCWDLAKLFLEEGPRCVAGDVAKLARAIQDLCEDHCWQIEQEEKEKKGGTDSWEIVRERFRQNVREIAAGEPPTFPGGRGAAPRQRIRGKIRAWRQGLRLTRSQFAERLGIDRDIIVRWESGEDSPTPEHLGRLQELGLEL